MIVSRRLLLLTAIAASIFARAGTGHAQTATRPAQRATLCFRPKQFANCQAFVFLDGTGALGVYQAPRLLGALPLRVNDFPSYAAGSIGYMSNIDSSHAIGAGLEGCDGAKRTSAGLHAGARVEGYPALAAAVGAAGAFALVWAALRESDF